MTKTRSIILLIIILLTVDISKAQNSLSVNKIPANLKENADAVMRYSYTYFEMKSIGEGVYKKNYALTILNPKGKDYAEVSLNYDQLVALRNISAAVYDKNGLLIKKLKKSEIKDYSSYDGISILSDNRIKQFELGVNDYPYTIEVSYEEVHKGLMSLPTWVAQYPGKISIQESEYKVVTPADYKLRYKNIHVGEPEINQTEEGKVYSWSLKNSSLTKSEPLSQDSYSGYKMVMLAPSDFKMDGIVGNMETWKGFGQWRNKLNSGLDELTEEELADVKNLIKGVTNEKQRVKLVYEYLQQNTRYVSIQLGIGGWKSFPASYVAENGFGDCKALTNYTRTVLKNIGTDSYYTLVRAGDDEPDIDINFPSNQFNHVFLCVPIEQDTVWLECTSQTNPFGYLSDFTSDRNVLVINEDGGYIVKTPAYTEKVNVYATNAEITLDEDGFGKGLLNSSLNGLHFDYLSNFNRLNQEDKIKRIKNLFPIKNLEVLDFQFNENRSSIPSASLQVEVGIRRMASASGKRFFLIPNQISQTEYIPSTLEERKSNFSVKYEKTIVDSISYTIPSGMYIERLPKSENIQTEFGSYITSYQKADGFIRYIRKYTTLKGVFDKSKYSDFVKFHEKCVKADKQKIVFVKNT